MRTTTLFLCGLFYATVLSYAQITPDDNVIYVKTAIDVNDGANGSSWDEAVTFSAALDYINANEPQNNGSFVIRMANGEYPIYEKAFHIKNNVKIVGCYDGGITPEIPLAEPTTVLTRDTEEDRILIIAKSHNAEDRIKVEIEGVSIKGGLAVRQVPEYGLQNAPTSAFRGGGIFIGNAHVSLLHVYVIDNVADNGDNSSGNSAKGGGIYSSESELILNNCVISGNIATQSGTEMGSGGGIYVYNTTLQIENCEIKDNTASTTNSEGRGGGIYFYSGKLTIKGDEAQDLSSYKMIISGNKATTNDASGIGGGLYVNGGENDYTISSANISENLACLGGGIYSYARSFVMDGCLVNNNTASSSDGAPAGGGLYLQTSDIKKEFKILNTKIRDNNALGTQSQGGGIYHKSGALEINEKSVIEGNAATEGGGLYISSGGNPTRIIDTRIVGNQNDASGVKTTGGGIYNSDRGLYIKNCILSENTANGNEESKGGGIYSNVTSTGRDVTFVNSLISKNETQGYGGGIYNNGNSDFILLNTTVAGNIAGSEMNNGFGLFDNKNAIILKNSIIWGNMYGDLNKPVNHSHSLIRDFENNDSENDKLNGQNREDDYPLFIDAENGNYRLKAGSPVRGLSDVALMDGLDLDGNAVNNETNDLGPYWTPLKKVILPDPQNAFIYDLNKSDYIEESLYDYKVSFMQNFSFGINISSGYAGTPKVTVNGKDINLLNGFYTFPIEEDMTVVITGIYRVAEPGPLYPVTFEIVGDGELDVRYMNIPISHGDNVDEGISLNITASADAGYELNSLQVNGVEIENGTSYKVQSAIHIYVQFVMEDPDPNPDPGTSNTEMNGGIDIRSAHGQLLISTDKPCLVRIMSINGRTMTSHSLPTGDSMIPLSTGIYIVSTDKGNVKIWVR